MKGCPQGWAPCPECPIACLITESGPPRRFARNVLSAAVYPNLVRCSTALLSGFSTIAGRAGRKVLIGVVKSRRTHSCCMISSIVARLVRSTCRMRPMRSLASAQVRPRGAARGRKA